MNASPFPGNAPINSGPASTPGRAGALAVMLAIAVVAVVAVSYGIFGIALALGGWDAVEDNWVGFLGVFALLGGLLGSLVAFALAVVAKARHQAAARLWLPLVLFPALLSFVVLGEAFWWE